MESGLQAQLHEKQYIRDFTKYEESWYSLFYESI